MSMMVQAYSTLCFRLQFPWQSFTMPAVGSLARSTWLRLHGASSAALFLRIWVCSRLEREKSKFPIMRPRYLTATVYANQARICVALGQEAATNA